MGRRRIKLKDLGKIISSAIQFAEDLFPDPKSGETKKAFVVDLINEKVDIPLLNENQEEMLLSVLIDVICTLVLKR